MTALGAEVAARFASGFALLVDLRQLAPNEHAEIMHRVVAEVATITAAEKRRRLPRRAAP